MHIFNKKLGHDTFIRSSTATKLFISLFLVSGYLMGLFFLKYIEKNRVDMYVDADIQAGKKVEVYVNENLSTPLVKEIKPSSRQFYIFENLPGRITHLRIDPTDVGDAEVFIYSIEFRRHGELIMKIKPGDIEQWNLWGARWKGVNTGDFVRLVSTGDDPQLEYNLNVMLVRGFFYNTMSKLNQIGHSLDLICVTALTVLVLVFKSKNMWKSFYLAIILISSYILTWFLCKLTLDFGGNIPDVSNAVGIANYTGMSKEAEMRAFWVGIIGMVVWIFAAASIWKAIEKRLYLKQNEGCGEIIACRFSATFFIGSLLSFALLTFPYLQYLQTNIGNFIHSNQYDLQNHITWQYFRHLGLIPFKDFWYPYNGFYYFYGSFPPDRIFFWLHGLLLFGVCAGSIYKILDFSKKRGIIIMVFILWLMLIDLVQVTPRYFLSLSLVLLFAVCVKARKKLPAFFLGVYTSYIFFMEPNQIFYALPGCIVILVAALFLAKNIDNRLGLLKNLGISVIISTLVVGAYLLYLARLGALFEFLMFYRTMGDLAIVSMMPSGLLEWFFIPGSENLLLGMTLGLIVLSLWRILTMGNGAKDIRDFVPLAIGLLSLLAFQKQMVRPHMALQLMGLPAVGLVLLAVQGEFCNIRGGIITKGSLSVFIGFLFMMFVVANGTAALVWQNYIKRLVTLPKEVKMALAGPSVWEKIERSYFAPAAFPIDGISGTEFRGKVLKKIKFEKKDDLFVLGDDSYLYIVLEREAPFYITLYNQSILHSQQNTVTWLEEHKPKYVFWRGSFKAFDDVQNIVRVPLIFEHIIRNYKYADTMGSFLILERRQHGEPVVLDFWRTYLGDTINLGFIPSRSDPVKFEGAGGSPLNHFTFLTASFQNPVQGKEREIVLDISGQIYKIKFWERKDIRCYNILLDRIWFWQAAESNGMGPKIYLSQDPTMKVEVKEVDLSKNILF